MVTVGGWFLTDTVTLDAMDLGGCYGPWRTSVDPVDPVGAAVLGGPLWTLMDPVGPPVPSGPLWTLMDLVRSKGEVQFMFCVMFLFCLDDYCLAFMISSSHTHTHTHTQHNISELICTMSSCSHCQTEFRDNDTKCRVCNIVRTKPEEKAPAGHVHGNQIVCPSCAELTPLVTPNQCYCCAIELEPVPLAPGKYREKKREAQSVCNACKEFSPIRNAYCPSCSKPKNPHTTLSFGLVKQVSHFAPADVQRVIRTYAHNAGWANAHRPTADEVMRVVLKVHQYQVSKDPTPYVKSVGMYHNICNKKDATAAERATAAEVLKNVMNTFKGVSIDKNATIRDDFTEFVLKYVKDYNDGKLRKSKNVLSSSSI